MWHTNGSTKNVFPGSRGVKHIFTPKKMKGPDTEHKQRPSRTKYKAERHARRHVNS